MAGQPVQNIFIKNLFSKEGFGKDLGRTASQLKKTTPKQFMDQVSEEDIATVAKIYEEKSEDPDALAAAFNVDAQMIRDNPPDDAAGFATNLFKGVHLKDKTAATKDEFRQRLAGDIKSKQTALRKSITRQSTGPTSDDLAKAAAIYTEFNGDLEKIAQKHGLTERLMNNDPPWDAKEFAQKLLAGNYTEATTKGSKA